MHRTALQTNVTDVLKKRYFQFVLHFFRIDGLICFASIIAARKIVLKGRYKIAYKSVRDLLSARITYVIVVHIFVIQLTIVSAIQSDFNLRARFFFRSKNEEMMD